MKTEDIRESLIKGTIQTVSDVGIDRATTKLLATNANVNEVYIYRLFGGKEELFRATYDYIDYQFASIILKNLKQSKSKSENFETYTRVVFDNFWEFSLNNKEVCSFFIKYYYSRYYTKQISDDRKKIYAKAMAIFSTAFKNGTDTWWLFNHILDVVFSSAVKVLRGEIEDDKQTQENVFNLLLPAIKQYIKISS